MKEYFNALLNNLTGGLHDPCIVELIGSLDSAYRTLIKVPPKGPQLFGRILLICHKSMLSAASLIAQTQPEDSVAITRRALEAAKVALAIRLNDNNAKQWLSYQERHDRWVKRGQGEKPKSFHVQFADIKGEPIMEEIDSWLGTLSDASVHFTPEFYDSLDWEERIESASDGHIFLNYFHRNRREIERHYITVAAVHGSILRASDKCFDGGFSGDPEKLASINTFWKTAKRFSDEYQQKYGTMLALNNQ